MHRRWPQFLSLTLLLAAAGCREDKPQAYRAPKDESPRAGSAAASPASSQKPPWVVPQGWSDKPSTGGMRVASYGVTAADGRAADVSVVALSGEAGGTLDNVNRWRDQVGLGPVTADDLSKLSQVVKIGDRDAALFEAVGDKPTIDGKFKARTIAAVMPAGEMTVFFKITGEDALVSENKPKFLEWLKSVNTASGEESGSAPAGEAQPGAAPSLASESPASGGSAVPKWTVPANWKPGGERPMRVATFSIPGDSGAPADMSISMLGGPAGGVLPNVNRWRGQIGLPAWTDAELSGATTKVDVDGVQAVVVDFAGDKTPQGESRKTRILGAIVPRGEQTWFYKLTGDDPLVARERENFLSFVKSVKH